MAAGSEVLGWTLATSANPNTYVHEFSQGASDGCSFTPLPVAPSTASLASGVSVNTQSESSPTPGSAVNVFLLSDMPTTVSKAGDNTQDGTVAQTLPITVVATASTGPVPLGLVVNSTADAVDDNPGDDVCDDGTGACTLRAAIMEANAYAGGATIALSAETYNLTLGSELSVNAVVKLTGAGAPDTIIQAGASPGVASHRVFDITGGNVRISGVTIRHGNTSSGGGGIQVQNAGTLTLTFSIVNGNNAFQGGGILNLGALAAINTTFRSNTASTSGGGIHSEGSLNLRNSTVRSNNALNAAGVFNFAGNATVTNSTINGNTATSNGGGITNSGGGGLAVTNATVTSNKATSGFGGGIYRFSGTVNLTNTIISGNTSASGPDCSGTPTSQGHNLIGEATGCTFTPATGDQVGTQESPVDPLLAPLQDNGGPTFVHALLTGSPAIDAGDDSAAPATDQRGISRPQGAATDIGAFERELVGTPNMIAPIPDSVLSGSSVAFEWTANGPPVTDWTLYAGSNIGNNDYYDSGTLPSTTLSNTATGLPTDGTTVHVRLLFRIGGIWQSSDFTYTASQSGLPSMNSPTPGSVLPGSSVTFEWSANGAPITFWALRVGSSLGNNNFHDSGTITSLSRTVTGLPTNGSTVFVRLFFFLSGVWQSDDFTYTAAGP